MSIKKYKSLIAVAIAVLVFGLIVPVLVRAEEERTTHKLGQTTASVNVREGAGENTYAVMEHNGAKVQLPSGTSVIIVDEAVYQQTGKVWYNIIFYLNGEELSGWVTSSFVSVVGTVTSTPTPTPEVTETPTPEPTNTPEPTQEAVATPEPTVTLAPAIGQDSNIYKTFWNVVISLLVIAVIIIIIIYVYNRYMFTRSKNSEVNKKMKYLKNVDIDDEEKPSAGFTGSKRPSVRVIEDTVDEGGNRELDERAVLRAKLDKLKQHDIVTHKFFGKGEVYDNSDVKLIEVRFGMDVRYLNKDSLAAKNLLVIDDDTLPTKRKL